MRVLRMAALLAGIALAGGSAAAILVAGQHVGSPLTLAAGATAAGFLSFLPTDYRGVSELGLIAGFGMLIAFATSVTRSQAAATR